MSGKPRKPIEYKTPLRVITCPTCGTVFQSHKINRKYCRDECRPMKTRNAKKLTSTERGYGSDHQRRRRELLPHAYGKPCPIGIPNVCLGIMQPGMPLHLDHSTPLSINAAALGDRITCAPCNISRGNGLPRARFDHAKFEARKAAQPTSRRW